MSTPFLTAAWRSLLMLNYEVDPAILEPHVPRGTKLDFWNGKTFVSIVGFMFENVRVLGAAIPFHVKFEEVNLRFYVRREMENEMRRGVTFLREIVPRHAIALVANALYNERYIALPMRHNVDEEGTEYSWRFNNRWNSVRAQTGGDWQELQEDSIEEFIAEHYWGYATQRDGGCMEYRVEHPRWRVKQTTNAELDCNIAALYGAPYQAVLQSTPASAFIADGSPVTVYRGVRL